MKISGFVLNALVVCLLLSEKAVSQTFTPQSVTDQTLTAPLSSPTASGYQPRYISGFGQDDSFTIFYEDRDNSGAISYVSTTTGPGGFPASGTVTNITDTHFCVKDWPITIDAVDYDYRGWGSVGNNTAHRFYVSNDLTNWTMVTEFTIPNASSFTDARGFVYYGFHDVILLNGTYYAFGESNGGQTMIVRSTAGDTLWEAFDSVGGTQSADGPLLVRSGVTGGWTPSGNFLDLGYDRGYGKIHVDPTDSYFYFAINTAAKASLSAAELEAAFINPANWTWHDAAADSADNPILSATGEHDLRECWVVPNSDPDSNWVIIYDADFGAGDGDKALGYATLTPEAKIVKLSLKLWLEGPFSAADDTMRTTLEQAGYIPTTSPYSDGRTVGTVPDDVVDWIYVELRTNADSDTVAQKSFFLHKNGNVVNTDGVTTDLEFENVADGDYWVVVRHRNHLEVMSSAKVEDLTD